MLPLPAHDSGLMWMAGPLENGRPWRREGLRQGQSPFVAAGCAWRGMQAEIKGKEFF